MNASSETPDQRETAAHTDNRAHWIGVLELGCRNTDGPPAGPSMKPCVDTTNKFLVMP